MTATNEAADFFSAHTGGGGGAPSFKFATLGDQIKGRVVSTKVMDQTVFGSDEKISDGKGGFKKQLQVILDTKLRNWEGVSRIPTDDDGHPLPGSEDTGARAIYVKGWMIGPVADAALKATNGERNFITPGDILGVAFSDTRDTNKGNALKLYTAVVKAAPDGFEQFAEAAEETSEKAVKAASAPLTLDDVDEDEPPF